MVVKQVKHWLVTRANAARWRAIQDWAETRHAEFAQTRDGQGFLIDARQAAPGPLRIEWGASQRSYLPGTELRMRCETGWPSGPSGSVMAGILLLGLMARKSGANCSPAPMSTGWTR